MNQSLFHHSKQQEYCPQCGAPLQIKQGKKGLFLGCSAYPECDFVVREESETEEKIACPECKTGHLISRRGRQGKIFYGCDNFPKCKFSLPTKPYAVSCPTCHFPLSLLKSDNVERNGEKQIFQCANKTCRHIFEQ
ncbi:TPA: type I DNA topoisomerase [Haemophilus influenzae]